MPQGHNWIHPRRPHCGQQSGDDADRAKNDERDQHDRGRGAEDDVALVVRRLVDVGVERHRRDEVADDDCDDHADDAGDEGEGQAFEQELREDVAAPGAEGFEQADLACALGDRDEHDVHDADAADAERHGADDAEEDLERGAELHDLLRVFDRVPGAERPCRPWGRSGGGSPARREQPGSP